MTIGLFELLTSGLCTKGMGLLLEDQYVPSPPTCANTSIIPQMSLIEEGASTPETSLLNLTVMGEKPPKELP